MPGVNRVTDFHEKSSMRPLERVTAACGSKDLADCFTFVPVKFLRKDAIEIIKNGAVKTRVAKEFDGVVFAGTVTEYLPKKRTMNVTCGKYCTMIRTKNNGTKTSWPKESCYLRKTRLWMMVN